MGSELMPKLLELLCELVPQAGAIALLVNPNNVIAERAIRNTQEAARVARDGGDAARAPHPDPTALARDDIHGNFGNVGGTWKVCPLRPLAGEREGPARGAGG
jgi:hypothetical protein